MTDVDYSFHPLPMKQLSLFNDLEPTPMNHDLDTAVEQLNSTVRFMENRKIIISQRQRWEYLTAHGHHDDARAIAYEYSVYEFRQN